MPNLRKVNDNGPPPACPNYEDPMEKTLDRVMAEEAADIDLRDRQAASREGLCRDYTRAPWFVKDKK